MNTYTTDQDARTAPHIEWDNKVTEPVSREQLQFIKDRMKFSGFEEYIESHLLDHYSVEELESLPAFYYKQIIEYIERD